MDHPRLIASTWQNLTGKLEDWGLKAGADSGEPMTSGAILKTWGNVQTGIWRCTPGGWTVEDRPDEESVLILAGRAKITDADGTVTEVSEGSVFVQPQGWYGRWDVEETVVKYFVSIR